MGVLLNTKSEILGVTGLFLNGQGHTSRKQKEEPKRSDVVVDIGFTDPGFSCRFFTSLKTLPKLLMVAFFGVQGQAKPKVTGSEK